MIQFVDMYLLSLLRDAFIVTFVIKVYTQFIKIFKGNSKTSFVF